MQTPLFFKKALCAGTAALLLGGCAATETVQKFNPRTCMEETPAAVEGIKVLQGPRSKENIRADMHTAFCNGQVLLKLMNEKGKPVNPGTIWFKVSVEYTGEVSATGVLKSEVQSKEFQRRVSDMIMDSNFIPWQRDDVDTEFIYPMTFYRWWD